jgi:K+-sensing histidine kinase KdpD
MDAAIRSGMPFNNGENDMTVKTVTISLLICAIAGVHIFYHGSELGFHLLHQQLFYIPLVLASFWFGLRICVPTAILISLLYGIPMIFPNHEGGSHVVVVTQVFLYLLVSLLIGWLSDRERKQQSKLFQNERATALGKAASALSFEVQDIVRQIESIHHRKGGSQGKKDDMVAEIDRLKKLLGALTQFSSPLGDLTLSHDLNELILQRLPTYHQNAAAKGVRVVVDLDKGGCPSMVTTESIPRIIDALVENAIDFSEKGQSIVLRSKRGGGSCIFEVSDSGPGVSKENEAKLFRAFFTTKPDGYGISLSAGSKVLRELGGDLVYKPNLNGGAVFEMRIPRESSEDNIDGYVNSALPDSGSK